MKTYTFNYRHNAIKTARQSRTHVEKLNNDAEAIEFSRGLRMGGAHTITATCRNRVVYSH